MVRTYGALILAGGMGKRMGGRNKALLRLEEDTFFQRLREALSGFEEKLISANETFWAENADFSVVRDERPGCGPIEGLRRALKACESDALFVAACDMPLITREFAEALILAAGEHDVLICRDREGGLHPLCGVYSKACLPVIESMMDDGDYRIRQIAARTDSVVFNMEETAFPDTLLTNVNTPEELEQLSESRNIRQAFDNHAVSWYS